MRRRVCLLVCVVTALLIGAAGRAAQMDFSDMTLEELYTARELLNARINELEQAMKPRIYDSGTYLIGQGIPAGDYVLMENENAVFASVAVREGITEDSGLVAHHLINRQAVVRLTQGTWVTLTEARACPLAQVGMESAGVHGEGGYLVGATLPAGTYTASIIDKAPLSSYSVYDAMLGAGEQLVRFEVIREDTPIELSDGEYVELSGCRLENTAMVDGGN